MANEEQRALLVQGVEVWNQWRQANPLITPDLSDANLSRANLRDADLRSADLSGADLSDANLSRANLSNADLSHANLNGANLRDAALSLANLRQANLSHVDLRRARLRSADLRHTDLSGADLSYANLRGVNLSHADLRHADFSHDDLSGAILSGAILSEAQMVGTVLGNIDLSEVKGLETVRHQGPSTIGIDTIYHSQGQIPEAFLKGAGVPDIFIIYMQSLSCEAIQYYSCFISYSSKDAALAHRLYNDLQAQGVRCWYAPEDLKWGAETREGIDHAIRLHDKLLLILSKHSVESDWVQKEVETAFEEERARKTQQKKKSLVLFPVRIDNAVMKSEYAWAADIRRMRNIGNFIKWKDHATYQTAFDRLLRDLKVETSNNT